MAEWADISSQATVLSRTPQGELLPLLHHLGHLATGKTKEAKILASHYRQGGILSKNKIKWNKVKKPLPAWQYYGSNKDIIEPITKRLHCKKNHLLPPHLLSWALSRGSKDKFHCCYGGPQGKVWNKRANIFFLGSFLLLSELNVRKCYANWRDVMDTKLKLTWYIALWLTVDS